MGRPRKDAWEPRAAAFPVTPHFPSDYPRSSAEPAEEFEFEAVDAGPQLSARGLRGSDGGNATARPGKERPVHQPPRGGRGGGHAWSEHQADGRVASGSGGRTGGPLPLRQSTTGPMQQKVAGDIKELPRRARRRRRSGNPRASLAKTPPEAVENSGTIAGATQILRKLVIDTGRPAPKPVHAADPAAEPSTAGSERRAPATAGSRSGNRPPDARPDGSPCLPEYHEARHFGDGGVSATVGLGSRRCEQARAGLGPHSRRRGDMHDSRRRGTTTHEMVDYTKMPYDYSAHNERARHGKRGGQHFNTRSSQQSLPHTDQQLSTRDYEHEPTLHDLPCANPSTPQTGFKSTSQPLQKVPLKQQTGKQLRDEDSRRAPYQWPMWPGQRLPASRPTPASLAGPQPACMQATNPDENRPAYHPDRPASAIRPVDGASNRTTPPNGPCGAPNGPHAAPLNGRRSAQPNRHRSSLPNGPRTAPSNGPRATPPSGPRTAPAQQKEPRSTQQNGPRTAQQNGSRTAQQNGSRTTQQNGPRKAQQNGPRTAQQNGACSALQNGPAARLALPAKPELQVPAGSQLPPKPSRAVIFTEHTPVSEMQRIIETRGSEKEYCVGTLRINRKRPTDAYVTVDGFDADVYIPGSRLRNRAFDGDTVAVRLIDEQTAAKYFPKENFPVKMGGTKKERKENPNREDGNISDSEDADEVYYNENAVLVHEEIDQLPAAAAGDGVVANLFGEVVAIMEAVGSRFVSGVLHLERPGERRRQPSKGKQPAKPSADNDAPAGDNEATGDDLAKPDNGAGEDKTGKENEFMGPVKQGDFRFLWFQPTDKRVPLMTVDAQSVPTEYFEDPTRLQCRLFLAKVQKWDVFSRHPRAAFVRDLGEFGIVEVETEAILVNNGVSDEPFLDHVLESLPLAVRTGTWSIPDVEISARRDLRGERVFSIDPLSARDLDDALHIKELENGNFEVGVHIADVTYFVLPGSKVDEEAARRATTVYLVQKCIPMLPPALCENLCSLNPGQDKLCFSVVWEMDSTGNILNEWIGRTVIRSVCKLAYEHAQKIIEGGHLEGCGIDFFNAVATDIETDLQALHKISQELRARRFKSGALSMGSVKLTFDLDEDGQPAHCAVYKQKEANRLIEEFMLLANMKVAEKISAAFTDQALLRQHGIPSERRMNDLAKAAAKLGFELDVSSAGALNKSIETIEELHGSDMAQVVRTLCIRPMLRARYFCAGVTNMKNFGHYALNVPLYTHFTSPIRRYVDIVVHRLLDFAVRKKPRFMLHRSDVSRLAKHCNQRKDAARTAQDESSRLYLCLFLQARARAGAPVVADAVVFLVQDASFDVLVLGYGIEARIHLEDVDLRRYVWDPKKTALRIYWTPHGRTVDANLANLDDGEGRASRSGDEPQETEPPADNHESNLCAAGRENLAGLNVHTIRPLSRVKVRLAAHFDRSPPTIEVTYIREADAPPISAR